MSLAVSKAVDSSKVFIEQKSNVTARWDPHYHSPRFANLDRELNLMDAVPLRKVSKSIFSGITPLSGGDAYIEGTEGIAFIRSGDFNDDGTINEDSLIRLKPEVHEKLMRRSQLEANDVLFAIVGATIGKVGIFPGGYQANINQAVSAVRLNKDVLPHFAHAFFLTRLGQEQIERIKRPVARANINLDEVGTLRIPVFPASKQRAVILALSEAFAKKITLEAKAIGLMQDIDDVLLEELGIRIDPEPPNKLERRMFHLSFSDLTGTRFDPIAHQEKRQALEGAIHASKFPIYDLRKLVKISKIRVKEIEEDLTYVGLENIDGKSGEYIAISEKESVGTATQFRPGQILFPKLRPYLNKTHLAGFNGVCSTEFHVFEPEGATGEYLTAFLRSRAIVGITSLLMTGNTLPRLQMSDIERLPIPVPSPDLQRDICFEISKLRAKAIDHREQARADLEKAKRDIEAMIFGKEPVA
jgi:restriction endonuclease S subunit